MPDQRLCEFCRKPLPPRKYMESAQAYKHKRFCSRECVYAFHRGVMKGYSSKGRHYEKSCHLCKHKLRLFHDEQGFCSLCTASPNLNLPCALRFEFIMQEVGRNGQKLVSR